MKRFIAGLLLIVGCGCSLVAQTEAGQWINTLREHIRITGYAQGGFDYYDKSESKDQFKIARIILMANAQINDQMSAFAMYDLNSAALHEIWYNYKACEGLQIKLGQFKTPFTIENPLSPTVLETAFPNSLVVGNMILGADALMMPGAAGRDIGVTLYGTWAKGLISYDLALMNGAGRNKADNNSQKDLVATLRVKPSSWLLLSGSIMKGTGNVAVRRDASGNLVSDVGSLRGLKANGNYRRDRYSAGFQLKTDPFNLRSEYLYGKDGHVSSKGAYATATVNHLLMPHLDLIGSFDWLDKRGTKQNRWVTGLQYWFYPQCRVQLNYARQHFNGNYSENCILVQLQVKF